MGDAAAATVWFLGSAIGLGTAVQWAQVAFPLDSRSDRVIHVIVFCWALIVVNAVFLELFGGLAPHNLIVATGATCAVVWWWLWKSPNSEQWPVRSRRARLGRGDPRGDHGRRAQCQMLWRVAWILLGAVAVARSLTSAATTFPSDWDSLAYHIPLVDHWIRDGTLNAPACAFWYCPGNSELVAYWLVGPFSGDFWIGLNNLPTVGLLAFSSVKLLASLKVVRPVRHLAGMAVTATGVTWRQLVTNENDVAVAALFVASLWYAVRVSRHRKSADLMLCAMCFGLLAGTKYVALGYAGVAALAVVGLLLLHRHPQQIGRASRFGLAGAILLGSYWYLRNYVATGSPLFPKGLLGSTDLWASMRPESASSSLALSGRPVVVPLLWDAISAKCGWFHVAGFVLLPGILIAVGALIWSGTMGTLCSRTRIWLLGVVLLANVVFVNTPNVVETAPGSLNMLQTKYHPVRLGFAAVTITALALAVALSDAGRLCTSAAIVATRSSVRPRVESPSRPLRAHTTDWLRKASIAAVSAAVIAHVWSVISSDVTPTLILSGIVLCVTYIGLARVMSYPIPLAVIAVGGLLALAVASQMRATVWHKGYTDHYAARFRTEIFRRPEVASGTSGVICVCDYRYYPFFGSRRQSDVCRPLWVPTSRSLLTYVAGQNAALVVSRRSDVSAQMRYATVPDALASYSDLFIPLVQDSTYLCVRVDREALNAVLARRDTP